MSENEYEPWKEQGIAELAYWKRLHIEQATLIGAYEPVIEAAKYMRSIADKGPGKQEWEGAVDSVLNSVDELQEVEGE